MLWYRLLGVAALVGQRLSRQRVNFVPLNWPLMVGLVGLAIWSLIMVRDGVVNGTTPRRVALSELVLHKGDLGKNYVRTTGMLIPESQVTKVKTDKNSGAETLETVWVPLADTVSKKILLVQRAEAFEQAGQPHAETITGMLVPIDGELHKEMESSASPGASHTLDLDFMLVEGKSPANPALWIPLFLLSSALGAAMVVTFLSRYIVWRRTGEASIPLRPSRALPDSLNLRATGDFALDGKAKDRFLEVPAGIWFSPGGDVVAFARVNASSKFMGFVTQDRNGTWVMPLGNPRGQSVERGEIYLGGKQRPALRWKPEGQSAVILSTDTDDECQALLDVLSHQPEPGAS